MQRLYAFGDLDIDPLGFRSLKTLVVRVLGPSGVQGLAESWLPCATGPGIGPHSQDPQAQVTLLSECPFSHSPYIQQRILSELRHLCSQTLTRTSEPNHPKWLLSRNPTAER